MGSEMCIRDRVMVSLASQVLYAVVGIVRIWEVCEAATVVWHCEFCLSYVSRMIAVLIQQIYI